MTRLSALLLALLLLLPAGLRADARITVWQGFTPEETELFRKIADEFAAEYSKARGETVTVELDYVSFGDMFTKLKTAALANITPDIAFVDTAKMTELAFGKAIVPLTSLEGFKKRYGTIEKAREQFLAGSFDESTINRLGTVDQYGLPVQTTCVALFWNKAMFRAKADQLRAAGLDPNRAPQTWDELLAYGKVLTDAKRGVFGFGLWKPLWFNYAFFNLYNVDLVTYDDSGTPSFSANNEKGRAALGLIKRIQDSGTEGQAWQGIIGPDTGFLNEKYAMIMVGPWMVQKFANQKLDFGIDMIPAPSKEEVEKYKLQPLTPDLPEKYGHLAYSSSNLGGQAGVIMRSCQDRELAYEFLEYFTSEKVQRRWASQLGQIPVRRAAWKDLDMSKYPFMVSFMKQMETSRRRPSLPLVATFEDIFNREFDLFLRGQQDAGRMLDRVESGLKGDLFRRMQEGVEMERARAGK